MYLEVNTSKKTKEVYTTVVGLQSNQRVFMAVCFFFYFQNSQTYNLANNWDEQTYY